MTPIETRNKKATKNLKKNIKKSVKFSAKKSLWHSKNGAKTVNRSSECVGNFWFSTEEFVRLSFLSIFNGSQLRGHIKRKIQFEITFKLGTSNRELNLERWIRIRFFKLTSMGKTLRGEKIFQNKKNFILIFGCIS